MKEDDLVKRHFERNAEEFDKIYDNQGGILKRFVNNVFRRGMYERVDLTLQECKGDTKTILDIGCGPGRVALLLARRGAKVIGVDFSSKMIELANRHLREHEAITNAKLNVQFICCDFIKDFFGNELFDVALALGLFGYIKDPIPFLEKMKNLTKKKIIASYPAKFAFQAPIRKVWLWTKGCPVYFYTKRKLETMYASVGIFDYEIVKQPTEYFVPEWYWVVFRK